MTGADRPWVNSVIAAALVVPQLSHGAAASWPGLGSSLCQRRRVNSPGQQVLSLSETRFQIQECLLLKSHLHLQKPAPTDVSNSLGYLVRSRQNKCQPYRIKQWALFILGPHFLGAASACCEGTPRIAQRNRVWVTTALHIFLCSNKDIKYSMVELMPQKIFSRRALSHCNQGGTYKQSKAKWGCTEPGIKQMTSRSWRASSLGAQTKLSANPVRCSWILRHDQQENLLWNVFSVSQAEGNPVVNTGGACHTAKSAEPSEGLPGWGQVLCAKGHRAPWVLCPGEAQKAFLNRDPHCWQTSVLSNCTVSREGSVLYLCCQKSSHQPHGASEHLKWETEF